jgi:hypothetical protein
MTFHPFTRFEIAHFACLALFMLAGGGGLLAIWLGVGLFPVAVISVSPADAMRMFVLEATLITASIALALAARTVLVREWLRIAGTVKGAQIKALHGFITGSGLILAWGALLVPAFTAALLSVSAFMALVVVGMVYWEGARTLRRHDHVAVRAGRWHLRRRRDRAADPIRAR